MESGASGRILPCGGSTAGDVETFHCPRATFGGNSTLSSSWRPNSVVLSSTMGGTLHVDPQDRHAKWM